jgi:hypothetical protein
MDIVRLPVVPLARPAAAPPDKTATAVAAGVQPAAGPVAPAPRQRCTGEACEGVVQGELLERRERSFYQSTRAFLDERSLNHARPAEQAGRVNPQQSRSAIALYLNNARTESVSDLTQGSSINFFV